MKNILLACGTGIVTSTAVTQKLSRALDERGYEGRYKITQCKITEVPSKSADVDFCVATTMVSGDVRCPVIQGVAFLTGRGVEPILAQIIGLMEQK